MNRRKIDRIKPEVVAGVARDTGRTEEEVMGMLTGKASMTFDVTQSLIDRDSDLHWKDFNR